jgi:predicted amidohydrolase
MSSVAITDACDAFAQVLPVLCQEANYPSRQTRIEWKADTHVDDRAKQVSDAIIISAGVPANLVDEIVANLRNSPDRASATEDAFALLLGIDRGFAGLEPFKSDDRDELWKYRERLWQHNRLDSGAASPVRVLPRRVVPARGRKNPEHLKDEFEHLLLVHDSPASPMDYSTVDPQYDMTTEEIRRTEAIEIACVPFLGNYDELEITNGALADPSIRYYSIRPGKSVSFWEDRMDRILDQLESKNVHFAILPELALSDNLLVAWKNKLRARSGGPRWLLAGTGGLGSNPSGNLPPNRAMLLSRSGAEVMDQDKLRPFDMPTAMVVRWQLGHYLDKQDHIEGMTEGTTRRIRDLRAGRVAILICEDHGRMIQEAANLAEHGPSLIFVPIFSEPIRQYRWEYNAAADHVLALGASVVVSNSCAVPVPADTVDNFVKKGVVYGTSLAAWPKEDAFGYSAVNVQITPFDPDPEKVSYFQVPLT